MFNIELAERSGKSSAQVLIRWSLERGHITLPKSSNHERIAANADIFDFEIDQLEGAKEILDELSNEPYRSAWDPTEVE